jgi:diaminohydroxyphosphoribosylaminopyrimidine deaminase/5-amino-6-(5-phosphoribosylamino)uracil reductase
MGPQRSEGRLPVHTDADLMARALDLAAGVRRRTPPNPWVGCVVARDGEVVGEGTTEEPGRAHAEVGAIASAGERARGATVYTTLEPCSHHGRTPPCADALIAAGVRRVVVALEDPDPHVRGAGIERLRARGVTVEVGLGAEPARRLLQPYLVHRTLGRASVVLKTATSLDGRIAARDGSSRWITGDEARADAHELRADSQAGVVGAGTALADRPSLTARDTREPVVRQPLRVLLDARGRVPADGPLFDTAHAPTLVVTTAAAPEQATSSWLAAGAKVQTVPAAADGIGVDLTSSFELLGGLGVVQALVEGGAQLAGALLDAGLVDRLVAYLAPVVLGARATAAFDTPGPPTLDAAARLQLVAATRLGDDLRLDYEASTPPGGRS